MGTLFGFIVGYFLGARAGNDGYQRVVQAWQEVRDSDEFINFLRVLRGHTQDTLRTVSERLGDEAAPPMSTSVSSLIAEAQARLRGDPPTAT